MKLTDLSTDDRCDLFMEVAGWLEGRKFRISGVEGGDPHDIATAKTAWLAGYKRAVFELRTAVANSQKIEIPDDISELD